MSETVTEERTQLEILRSSLKKVKIRVIMPDFNTATNKLVVKTISLGSYNSHISLFDTTTNRHHTWSRFTKLKEDRYIYKKGFSSFNFGTLYKEIQKNVIEDKDKVYFTKQSSFPKLSFNRYSDKAKKVNSVKTCTKIVINNTHRTLEADNFWSMNYLYSENTPNILYVNFVDESFFNNYVEYMWEFKYKKSVNLGSLKANIQLELGKFANKLGAERIPRHNVIKEGIQNFELITTLTDPLVTKEMIVTDETADKYMNKFKDGLDTNMAKVLISQLVSQDRASISLGLQLIENMDLAENTAYLYYIFSKVASNQYVIASSKGFKTVAFKKVRMLYPGIEYALNNFSSLSKRNYSRDNLQALKGLLTFEQKEEQRELLFDLLAEDSKKWLMELMGNYLAEKLLKDE